MPTRQLLIDAITTDYYLIYGHYMSEELLEHLEDLDNIELSDMYYMQKDDLAK